MQFKSLLTLFICSLFLFSCDVDDDNMPSDDTPAPVVGSAIFTVVNCTDTSSDPTCTNTFDVLVASQIFLYTSAENREFNESIYAEKLTAGEGTAEFSNLEGGDYFYAVQYPTDATVTKESVFSIVNGSRAQVRVEFEEE